MIYTKFTLVSLLIIEFIVHQLGPNDILPCAAATVRLHQGFAVPKVALDPQLLPYLSPSPSHLLLLHLLPPLLAATSSSKLLLQAPDLFQQQLPLLHLNKPTLKRTFVINILYLQSFSLLLVEEETKQDLKSQSFLQSSNFFCCGANLGNRMH